MPLIDLFNIRSGSFYLRSLRILLSPFIVKRQKGFDTPKRKLKKSVHDLCINQTEIN